MKRTPAASRPPILTRPIHPTRSTLPAAPARGARSIRRRAAAAACALSAAAALLAAGCQERPIPQFDEARAFADVKAQVAMGPRVPGSEAHRRCRDWMADELRKSGGEVSVQTFADTVYGEVHELSNVRARFGPKTGAWIVLGAHWDTRATADQDPDPANHTKPIPGANDGGSGVAVLLELARVFGRTPPPVGVEIVLFDGEDLGRGGDIEGYCRGSRYYVKQLQHPRPALAVIVDMVGDKDLDIYQEQNSLNAARNIVERIWEGAAKVGATGFKPGPRHNVYDDHAPFLEAGIPGVDLIDFDYPAWHTVKDDLDQVAPGSLGQVGRTVLWYVYTSEWQ